MICARTLYGNCTFYLAFFLVYFLFFKIIFLQVRNSSDNLITFITRLYVKVNYFETILPFLHPRKLLIKRNSRTKKCPIFCVLK